MHPSRKRKLSFDVPALTLFSSPPHLLSYLPHLLFPALLSTLIVFTGTMSSPQALDYSMLLSDSARNRMPSAIRSLYPAELIPGMVSLLTGKPNSDTFPFQRILLELKPAGPGGEVQTIPIEGADLDIALQYSATSGIPKLVEWIEAFQSRIHKRPKVKEGKRAGEVWRCSFGNGSQDLLTKAFEALVNEGDSVVLESPAYS